MKGIAQFTVLVGSVGLLLAGPGLAQEGTIQSSAPT